MNNIFKGLMAGVLAFISMGVAAESITIDNGYVREVIPGNSITSAYMVINNTTDNDVTLVGASSTVSPRIEIHSHSMEDGMMKMRQLSAIQIKGKQSVVLQPMGFHLMIFDMEKPLKAGEKVDMTLKFSDSKDVNITIPVQSIKQKKHHH